MLQIYRASAGSGKTFRLTKDYINLLFSSANNEKAHRKILAVTFTNKATDEMKNRILKELYALSIDGKSPFRSDIMKQFKMTAIQVNEKAKKLLIGILHDYSSFSISTIDAFFQQILRSFTREIGIGGSYNLELNYDETLENAIDTLFQDLSKPENQQLLQWLTNYAEEKIEQSENWNIRTNINQLGVEIFKENYQNKAEETNKKLHNKLFLNSYIKKIKAIKTTFEQDVINSIDRTSAVLQRYGLKPEDFTRSLMYKTLESLKDKTYAISDTFLQYSVDVTNCYTKNKPQNIKNTIEQAYNDGLGDALKEIVNYVTVEIIAYNTANIVLKHLSTLGVLSDLAIYIKQITTEQNTMLISDTNMLLHKIIDDSDTPFLYERTGINVNHFMIDEFQDTSVLQWKNFKPLIDNSLASKNQNMLVGDVKQSIYRWRNSDWKLLQEKVENDFMKEQINNEVLHTNWRSDKKIVEFNNDFFKQASLMLQAKFNAQIDPFIPLYSSLGNLKNKIADAYTDIVQEVSINASEGHVRIEFIENNGTKDEWIQASLRKIPEIIENLVDQGYKLSDIAFLVRKNKEAVQLIDYLFQYKNSPEARKDISYNVIGNEGILLSTSLSVEFIISLLKTLENPKNDIQRTIMNYAYLRGKLKKTDEEAIKLALQPCVDDSEYLSPLFTERENLILKTKRNTSLFELTENIIEVFDIAQWYNEIVFIQAFQDVVFKYINTRNADLFTFLKWWDKSGVNHTINTPEKQEALRVMTIHKSKGLDFKVVILPLCEWNIESEVKNSLIWMQTDKEPFNELPLIPLNFSSKLGATVFAQQYYEEVMHQYVDSLNMAYVAFTRARHELICLTPRPKEKSEQNKKDKSVFPYIASISGLLANYTDLKKGDNASQPEDDILYYQLGNPTKATQSENIQSFTEEQLTKYPVINTVSRVFTKNINENTDENSQSIIHNRLNYGVIMHEVLQKLTTPTDGEEVIEQMICSGRISKKDSEHVRQSLFDFWKLPEIDKWFFTDGKILNEATILLPTGEHYRPDRVMIIDEHAVVTDYKFGDEKRSTHIKQIRLYADILQKMGYKNVETYLVYVTLSEVEKVH